jgi:hypothetical protein
MNTTQTQYMVRDTDEMTYCLRCARRLGLNQSVETLKVEIGWPLASCLACRGFGFDYCTCGRRPRAISGPNGRHCRCRRPG